MAAKDWRPAPASNRQRRFLVAARFGRAGKARNLRGLSFRPFESPAITEGTGDDGIQHYLISYQGLVNMAADFIFCAYGHGQ